MPITIQLPNDLEKRLEVLSKETGRPKTEYITEAVEEYLEDLEDAYLWVGLRIYGPAEVKRTV